MRAIIGIFVVLALLIGVVVAQEPRAYPATQTDLYVLEKLAADAEQLQKAEAQVKALRKAHEDHLAAFIADVTSAHAIALKPGESLGLSRDGKGFVVNVAPVGS